MNRYVFTSAAIALGLAACAQMGFDHGASVNCAEPNTHCVKVTVGSTASGARISADPEKLRVRGQSHVIFWRLDNASGQNYSFPDNGISFETEGGRREFSCRKQDSGVFRCLDPGLARGEFKYTIALTGSPAVPPLDPWVINE